MTLADKILAYMRAKKYQIATGANEVNVVYLEGANDDGTINPDLMNFWNDRRIIITHVNGRPEIILNVEATTEPGLLATNSAAAARRGGVARIQFGQFFAWKMGWHRVASLGFTHPALVQCAPLKVHRDANRDGKRTGDALDWGQGINQHSTRPGYLPPRVENWSEGCLVGRSWVDHERFIALLRQDPRYLKNDQFVFPTTIIAGDDFAKFNAKKIAEKIAV